MSLFTKLSYISRKHKLALFYDVMKPTSKSKVLDIGAEIKTDGSRGLQLIDSYLWKSNITAVNLSVKHVSIIKRYYPEVEAMVADACELPWPDNYFDIVYSNAVIEHLGSFGNQQRMASEVMRVGKRWFVTTPNRWFPFEFHLRIPLITWFPCRMYLLAGRIISYNHVSHKYKRGLNRFDLRLLTAKGLKRCFPTSRIIKQRVTFMPETLIAIGGHL